MVPNNPLRSLMLKPASSSGVMLSDAETVARLPSSEMNNPPSGDVEIWIERSCCPNRHIATQPSPSPASMKIRGFPLASWSVMERATICFGLRFVWRMGGISCCSCIHTPNRIPSQSPKSALSKPAGCLNRQKLLLAEGVAQAFNTDGPDGCRAAPLEISQTRQCLDWNTPPHFQFVPKGRGNASSRL